MKKPAVVRDLRKYIGCVMIRTGPTSDGEWSFTDQPIKIIGFTPDGRIKYRNLCWYKELMGGQLSFLPISFTDRNWCTYEEAFKTENDNFKRYIGRKIIRVRPTARGDTSFMNYPATVISAYKHHMVVKYSVVSERPIILGEEFMKPEDWQLAE